MENIKQQIEELNQSIAEINQARDKTVKYFENKIKQLEQQVNKPKIEIGKVYYIQFNIKKNNNYILGYIVEVKGEYATYFGLTDNGWKTDFFRIDNAYSIKEATKEEWETALTKHADKLYEGVEKVDRSGLVWKNKLYDACLDGNTSGLINGWFWYKGVGVMDEYGNFAKPVIEEKENYFEYLGVGQYRVCLEGEQLTEGKYKLVLIK